MAADTLTVELVYALPERCWRLALQVPAGATVAVALTQSRAWLVEQGLLDAIDSQRLAVFGQRVELDTALHDGDRIELLRPLLADPKQARRQRALKQPRRPGDRS